MKSTRKMLVMEEIPAKKTTNGGNGSYMARKPMKVPKGGLTKPITASGNRSIKAL